MASASFRVAGDADIAQLLDFMAALYAEDGTTPFVRAPVEQALVCLLREPERGRVWLIEQAGVPAGYLVVTWGFSLEFHGRDAYIDELYVAPAHRGVGLGGEAIALAEDVCRGQGVLALHLEVDLDNERAHAFYGRNGFAERGHRLMTKQIVPANGAPR